MHQRAELGFPHELGKLVVGTEVRRGQRGEGGRVEARLLANGRHQLTGAVDEKSAPRVRLGEELVQRAGYDGVVVFRERPTTSSNGHVACPVCYPSASSIWRRIVEPRRLSPCSASHAT